MKFEECLPLIRTEMYDLLLNGSKIKGEIYLSEILHVDWSVSKRKMPFVAALKLAKEHGIRIRRVNWACFEYVEIVNEGVYYCCGTVVSNGGKKVSREPLYGIDHLLADDWEACD